MKSPLHILHLEDNAKDAEIVQSTLEAEGITGAATRVQSHDDFVAALQRGGIDLILFRLRAARLRRDVGVENRAGQLAGHPGHLRLRHAGRGTGD